MKIHQRNQLFNAIRANDIVTVKEFLEDEDHVDIQNSEKDTALITSIYFGANKVFNYLIERKADVNIQNRIGMTAGNIAIIMDRPDILRFLIDNELNTSLTTCTKESMLFMAAKRYRYTSDNQCCFDILLPHSDISIANHNNDTVLMALVEDPSHLKYGRNQKEVSSFSKIIKNLSCLINKQNNQGETALINAAKKSDTESLIALINHGADVNLKDNSKQTALIIAAKNSDRDSLIELIHHGAKDKRTAFDILKNNNDTALATDLEREILNMEVTDQDDSMEFGL